ncbi:hypothetical protein OAU50_06980 [Planctomycetota bacterium]|nr:hypothetical protein [Planctomycetota bacterium]
MDKQKKQLIALVVLVVVAGGIGAWNMGLFGKDKPATPAPDQTAVDPTQPAATDVNAGLPAEPGAPAKPAVKLSMPKFGDIPEKAVAWDWAKPIWERGAVPPQGKQWPAADPFRVLNIDVVDPNRHAEIKSIMDAWVLEGITRTMQTIFRDSEELDENGNPVRIESREYVFEAWFEGTHRIFRVGDRLPDTRFKIKGIFRSSDPAVGEGVDLIGDTGATLIIRLAQPSRYD